MSGVKRKQLIVLTWAVGLLMAAGIVAWAMRRQVAESPSSYAATAGEVSDITPAGTEAFALEHGSVRSGGSSQERAAEAAQERAAQSLTALTNAVPLTADQKLVMTMDDLLDDGDEQGALKVARQLLKAEDREVRSDVVAALGWIGVRALPEISAMLGDADEEVADEALQQWLLAIDEIEEASAKASMLTLAMGLTQDEDTLQSIVMEFNLLPDDVIVRSLVEVIQGQNVPAADVAREEYESTTGESYTNSDAAEKWIKENFEPEE